MLGITTCCAYAPKEDVRPRLLVRELARDSGLLCTPATSLELSQPSLSKPSMLPTLPAALFARLTCPGSWTCPRGSASGDMNTPGSSLSTDADRRDRERRPLIGVNCG